MMDNSALTKPRACGNWVKLQISSHHCLEFIEKHRPRQWFFSFVYVCFPILNLAIKIPFWQKSCWFRHTHFLRFQEKFGMAAEVYGDQGMEQVKAEAAEATQKIERINDGASLIHVFSSSGQRRAKEEARGESQSVWMFSCGRRVTHCWVILKRYTIEGDVEKIPIYGVLKLPQKKRKEQKNKRSEKGRSEKKCRVK